MAPALVLVSSCQSWASLSPGIGSQRGPVRSIFVSWEYRKLFGFGFAFALVALVAGVLFLFVDLGRADRVLLLFKSPKVVHITIGAY